ncbi:hypothetical protein ACIQD3_18155 [Peribacillus loiseleuriae]|uniref:hypothetical protein n=1 Tax=Peribacillus loiseleuriae TaxID=1679170 RepID=UPI003830C6E3
MAANIGSYGGASFGDYDFPKPCIAVMAYTGHSNFTENDPIANVFTVERRVNALRKAGIEVEYRKYKNVGHGSGIGISTDAKR